MKVNPAVIVWALAAVFVFAAGCISLGSNGDVAATPQGVSSPQASSHSGTSAAPAGLTEAQKTQAINIAKSNAEVKDVLGKSGYSVTGVSEGGPAGSAIVYIEGGSTVHSDGSIWTPDIYRVTVDIGGNKVTDIGHTVPKALPTPAPI